MQLFTYIDMPHIVVIRSGTTRLHRKHNGHCALVCFFLHKVCVHIHCYTHTYRDLLFWLDVFNGPDLQYTAVKHSNAIRQAWMIEQWGPAWIYHAWIITIGACEHHAGHLTYIMYRPPPIWSKSAVHIANVLQRSCRESSCWGLYKYVWLPPLYFSGTNISADIFVQQKTHC